MAVRGKVEVEVDLKSSADQFYSIFRDTPHHLPKICSDLHAGQIHEEGRQETFKEKIECDDESKSITLVGFGGDVFNYYKSYKATWQVVAGDGGRAVATMIIEYEKLNESMPHLVNYLDSVANTTKEIDAHLVMT